MTARTINRELIVQNDLALGSGTVIQTRGAHTATEQKIELDFIFRDNDEIRYLDILRYTRASIHTNGPLKHYYFDPVSVAVDDDNDVLAPVPAIAAGRWLRTASVVNIGLTLDYNLIPDLVADLAIVQVLEPFQRAMVNGYHEPADGGGGGFYWDATSTDPADGGLTFLPTGHVGAGRWKRIVFSILNVHHFGAVGDAVTDDRLAFETAFLAAAANDLTIGIKDKRYNVQGLNVTIPSFIKILGTGLPILSNGDTLTLGHSARIRNLHIENWTGGGITLDPTVPAYYNFEQVGATNSWGIRAASSDIVINTLRVDGGYFSGVTQAAYYLQCNISTVNINDVKIDNVGDGSQDVIGIALGLGATYLCDKVDIHNCEFDGMQGASNAIGLYIFGNDVVIANNIIRNLSGTNSQAIVANVSNSIILGNVITDCGTPSGPHEGWIDCSYNGATVDRTNNNITISGNVLQGTAGAPGKGIHLNGTGTITNNRILGDSLDLGIKVEGSNGIDKFIVTNNHINCPLATEGILCKGITESIIMSNHIVARDYAIRGEVYQTNDFLRCDISHNYVEADRGFSFVKAADMRIDGNTFVTPVIEFEGDYKAGDWWFINGVMGAVSADFADNAASINTMAYKQPGLQMWDESTNKTVFATGPYPNDTWVDGIGTVIYTPA